jgi:hypothetical protein
MTVRRNSITADRASPGLVFGSAAQSHLPQDHSKRPYCPDGCRASPLRLPSSPGGLEAREAKAISADTLWGD